MSIRSHRKTSKFSVELARFFYVQASVILSSYSGFFLNIENERIMYNGVV